MASSLETNRIRTEPGSALGAAQENQERMTPPENCKNLKLVELNDRAMLSTYVENADPRATNIITKEVNSVLALRALLGALQGALGGIENQKLLRFLRLGISGG